MASETDQKVEEAKKTAISYAFEWGKSPLPASLLATLATALHFRPFHPLPMIFPPILLFSTYLNLSGYKTDSAGITAAWSGLYFLLARRRQAISFGSKFGARGLVRGGAMGLALANVVGGGLTYALCKREKQDSIV